MAKSETVSTAKKPEDLEKAYNSASKALSTLGIKMATKKPDPAKLGPAMAKKNKAAEFKLHGDTKTLKLTVECDGTVNTLGILDVAAEKDAEKRLAVLKALAEAGLISDAEVAAAQKAMDTGPDPKVVANLEREIAALEKKIADTKKMAAGYAGLKNYDAATKFPAVMKELEDVSAKKHTEENYLFLKAVAANMARPKLVAEFIDENGQNQINIDSTLREEIKSGAKEPSAAVAEVKKMITEEDLFQLKTAKSKELNEVIAAAEKRLAGFLAEKKKLGLK